LGRLTKEGLDYFSLDCKLDDKIYMVEVELGLEGFALFIKLLMKVYDEGYYLKWDDRTAKIFAKQNNIKIDVCIKLIDVCINEGLFNHKLYKKYQILTSNGIQKRYFEAIKRRKEIHIIKEYLINGIEKYINSDKYPINVYINSINDNIKGIDVDKSTQSKVKESKVKESIVNPSCRFSSDGGVYKITKYFFKELININNAVKNKYKDYSPKQIESLLQRWCDNIDKLIRIDNAEPDEIYKVLEWLFKDDFWSTVIQSTDNLRKTYSKLYAKLKGNKPNLQQDITKYNIQIKEILDYFKEKTGREFTTDSPGIDNMIILLKKGNLVRAFKWVIDAKCEDWLNNPKMDKYLTLKTLFGDNFENYIKEKEFSEVEKGGDEKNDN